MRLGGNKILKIRKVTKEELALAMNRMEMLREVNKLGEDYSFSESFALKSKLFFEIDDQTTLLAIDTDVIGCAKICYMELMPTYSHPTGRRAHLMNVFVRKGHRGKGIASSLVNQLIAEARDKGVTEISLDATKEGHPLYQKCGFHDSSECMIREL